MFNKKKIELGLSTNSLIAFIMCFVTVTAILGDCYIGSIYIKQLEWVKKFGVILICISGMISINDLKKNKKILIVPIINLIVFGILTIIALVLVILVIYFSITHYIIPYF